MKMILFAAIVLVLVTEMPVSGQDTKPDFRKIKWGMSKAEVIELEECVADRGSSVMCYGNFPGFDKNEQGITYNFVNDRVYEAVWIFLKKHASANMYVENFNKVQRRLERKYGYDNVTKEEEGTSEAWVWHEGLYAGDFGNLGLHLMTGAVSAYAEWKLPSTTIVHVIRGDNFKVFHGIKYSCPVLSKEAEQERAKQESEQF